MKISKNASSVSSDAAEEEHSLHDAALQVNDKEPDGNVTR